MTEPTREQMVGQIKTLMMGCGTDPAFCSDKRYKGDCVSCIAQQIADLWKGWESPEEVKEMDKRQVEAEKMLNREAAFEENRLREEVKYWKDKCYELGR